ncbi:MAG: hypothetical protein IPK35_20930 [Saprospiraceae bacterium]|nr:hypothetical protein [Saprospiraceae bacterium]
MTNLELLIKAIETKKPVSFEYNKEGKTPGVRTGNPHILYVQQYTDTTKPKNSKVDLWQTSGVTDTSDTKPLPSWRNFFFSDLINIVIHEDHSQFEIAEGYNPESDRYKEVIAKI